MDDASLPLMAPSSVQDTAHALRAAAQAQTGRPFFVLPYNRYEPAESEWWIAPTSENPAYHLGKIVVDRDARVVSPGERFVGLHVEKGVEGEATARYFREFHGERLVMTDSWLWHDFMAAMRAGQIERDAAMAEEAAGVPLTVMVIAGVQGVPDRERPDHRTEDRQADMMRFTCAGGRLTRLDEVRHNGRLDQLGTITSYTAMPDALASMRDVEVTWVEVVIGLRFAFAEAADASRAWSSSTVWERACAPWEGWLR